MLQENDIVKEDVASYISKADIVELEVGNSRFGIGIIMVLAGFLGIWGCTCLINGISQLQSFQELGHVLFTAFTGL